MRRSGPIVKFEDVLCRGCHSTPSYKNISSYLCEDCWKAWNLVRRRSESFSKTDTERVKKDIKEFVSSRGRYVWHAEVYLYFRPYPKQLLKKMGIPVYSICKELQLSPPASDRFVRQNTLRIKEAADRHEIETGRPPNVRALLKLSGMDFETFWGAVDMPWIQSAYGDKGLPLKYRFKDDDAFTKVAVDVIVREGRAMRMVDIMEAMGVCYPAYLENFKHITARHLHKIAGVTRRPAGSASFYEEEAGRTLEDLGFKIELQKSFPGLLGISEKRRLRFDLFLPEISLLVEINGSQHYEPNNPHYKESTVEHDRRKLEFVSKNNLELLVIDIRDYPKKDELKNYLVQKFGSCKTG